MNSFNTMKEAIDWLEGIPLYGKKDGLNNMRALLERLAISPDAIPVIHVAGTNGKGSCCAMLTQLLTDAGYRVGRYTSPHLVDYRERITIGDEMIPEADFIRLAARVRQEGEALQAAGGNHPTFFEILTAIAFSYYNEQKVDWIVLEVGVGGRKDATNVVTAPKLSIIASISLDHTKVLGDTVEAIAWEKAGIAKQSAPLVLSENPEGVYNVVKNVADEVGAPFVYAGNCEAKVYSNDADGLVADITVGATRYRKLRLNLTGSYQIKNLKTVLSAVEVLKSEGLELPESLVRESLGKVKWPGRMEYLPYGEKRLLVDGAHNGGAAEHLATYLGSSGDVGEGGMPLVFSALAKKDVASILKPLAASGRVNRLIFAPLQPPSKCVKAEELAELWKSFGGKLPILLAQDTNEALELAAAGPEKVILCAGSLYLVGEIEALVAARQ